MIVMITIIIVIIMIMIIIMIIIIIIIVIIIIIIYILIRLYLCIYVCHTSPITLITSIVFIMSREPRIHQYSKRARHGVKKCTSGLRYTFARQLGLKEPRDSLPQSIVLYLMPIIHIQK